MVFEELAAVPQGGWGHCSNCLEGVGLELEGLLWLPPLKTSIPGLGAGFAAYTT